MFSSHEDHSRREAWVPRNGVTNGVKDTRIQTTASDRQRDDGKDNLLLFDITNLARWNSTEY